MIRVGIVGLGDWGRDLVRSVQGKSSTIKFVAAATRRFALAKDFAAEQGLELHRDYAELLADDELDGVVLATPHSHHATQVQMAAAAGKSVLVEKPFTLDPASAERTAQECRAAGIVCAVGHTRRFLPAFAKLRELIASGSLGQVIHAEGNFSTDEGLHLAPDHWRAQAAECPAGGMTGYGLHIVDAFIALLGPVSEVAAWSERRMVRSEIDDTTMVRFRFRSDCTGYLATLLATAPVWRLHIFCSEGWVEMPSETRLNVLRSGGEVETFHFTPSDPVEAELDAARRELEAFADAVSGRSPYPIPLDQIEHGIAVLDAILRSIDTGSAQAV